MKTIISNIYFIKTSSNDKFHVAVRSFAQDGYYNFLQRSLIEGFDVTECVKFVDVEEKIAKVFLHKFEARTNLVEVVDFADRDFAKKVNRYCEMYEIMSKPRKKQDYILIN